MIRSPAAVNLEVTSTFEVFGVKSTCVKNTCCAPVRRLGGG